MCSIEVIMSRSVSSMTETIAREVLSWCSRRYELDMSSCMEDLMNDLNIKIIMPSSKTSKIKNSKVKKSAFPLPFNGEGDESKCQALRQNSGLYTQCQSVRKDGVLFCKQCQCMADKSLDGIPEYGTIEMRMAVGVMDYTDPKGRKPTAYTKVMKKYNITRDEVVEESKKFSEHPLLEVHFESPPLETKRGRPATKPKEVKDSKGAKGRPKKITKVLQIEDENDDLFASLVAEANADEDSVFSDITNTSSKAEEKAAKEAAKEQEKAAKEAAKEAEKLAKEQEKAAKEAAKEAEKLAKEQEKAAKEAAKEQEKAAKEAAKEQEKAAKEAAKEAEKLAKEQEKAAKEAEKTKEKAAKEAEKLAKEAEKAKEKAAKESKKLSKKDEDTDDEEQVLKSMTYTDGNKYLRSPKTHIVYEHKAYIEDQELIKVGMYDADNKVIKFENVEDSESELEEDDVEE